MALYVLGILLSVSILMHWTASVASYEMPFDPCLLYNVSFQFDCFMAEYEEMDYVATHSEATAL